MPKFGAHAFVWIPDWNTEMGNQAIAEAAKAGCDFIEIPILRPDDFDAAAHKKALKDAGIEAAASTVLPRDAHAPKAPDKAIAYLKACLDQLEAVGGTYLGGCIGYSLGYLTGAAPTAAERQTVIDVLGEVADYAKARGMTLSLEVCNRYETYMYNALADGQDAVKAVRALGFDNIELHADTYHMNIEEEGFYQPLVDAAETLGYIHMSESHRGLVGSGTVIWDQVFKGLADAHYTGPLVLESFAAVNKDLIAATCLWRPPNQPPAVLAGEGIKFLRDGAAKVGLA
ncbi:sugar phosphate isomerase/epimerase family protein [Aggregatilinea lenta]|uniref:sugar phosphate isomerase/epimerase family protein n=1 Tax=Aggregatilinea lenta TaxID=913108 RepID=UPI000E5A97E0|nr:sugar phosphate isomerase/epimerase family protein [Aggregatilinea lenta]